MWGEPSHGACQRCLLATARDAAWGEPARPGFPPEGETGKGDLISLLPQANCLLMWCSQESLWCASSADRT